MYDSIFQLGTNWKITTEEFMGSNIITIDNFYKTPHLVREFTLTPLPPLWKSSPESRNGCYYQDRRLQAVVEDSIHDDNPKFLSQMCGQKLTEGGDKFISNVTKYYKHSYNNIDNCYWWPHLDQGYNAIISLNTEFGDSEYPGTALYHPDDATTSPPPEGLSPWISKTEYRLVKHIKAKYNRCVMFDGLKFPHAMHINDYTFFDDFYRVNHVYFFKPHD